MAPLPYNNTDVLKVQYSHTTYGQREAVFRMAEGYLIADFLEEVADFLETGVSPIWSDDVSTTGATFQAIGSDFSLPIPFPLIAGTSSSPVAAESVPRFAALSARGSTSGRESKLGFYFTSLGIAGNYRFTPGESTAADVLRGAYQGLAGGGGLVSIGGDTMTVRNYVNAGYNSYWQRKLRTS